MGANSTKTEKARRDAGFFCSEPGNAWQVVASASTAFQWYAEWDRLLDLTAKAIDAMESLQRMLGIKISQSAIFAGFLKGIGGPVQHGIFADG